ncbi:MAG: endonuclease, partial [Chromatiaceae bacterium]
MRYSFLLSLCLLLVPAKALAFGSIGHQQVCDLAYQLVQPITKQQIDALLAIGPEQQFAKGCV